MGAETVVKKITASLGVEINDSLIENSYRIKSENMKTAEFSSVYTKQEMMKNVKKHRVDAGRLIFMLFCGAVQS